MPGGRQRSATMEDVACESVVEGQWNRYEEDRWNNNTESSTLPQTQTLDRRKKTRHGSFKIPFGGIVQKMVRQMTSISSQSGKQRFKGRTQSLGPGERLKKGAGNMDLPPGHLPGIIGLRNHGNTCFMNAILQCPMSHGVGSSLFCDRPV